jgi:hypothetical protein
MKDRMKSIAHTSETSNHLPNYIEPNIPPQYSNTLPGLIMALAFFIQSITPIIKIIQKKSK